MPPEVCEEVIRYFESSDEMVPGEVIGGYNPESKDSMDLCIGWDDSIYKTFTDYLVPFVINYANHFGQYGTLFNLNISEPLNVQMYLPNAGYPAIHTERSPNHLTRELVFITYLNTLTSENFEGGTEWVFQNFKANPICGDTYIFPAFFTHSHRGIIHPTEKKYIVTGWFHLETWN